MDPNQEEISELPDKEFRRLINMLLREVLEKGEHQLKEIKKKKKRYGWKGLQRNRCHKENTITTSVSERCI